MSSQPEAVPLRGGPPSYRRSLKNYLVKRPFQLRWTVRILLVAVAIFATLGGYITWKDQHVSDQLVEGLNRMGYEPEEVALMGSLYQSDDRGMLWGLLAAGGALVVVLAGLGIVLTHKVAGPVYALGRFMDQVRDGNLRPVRGFRKGDEFPELAESFGGMLASIRKREDREIATLDELSSQPGLPDAVRAALLGLAAEKRRALE